MPPRHAPTRFWPIWPALLLLAGCATTVDDLRGGQTGHIAWQHTREPIKLEGRLALPAGAAAKADDSRVPAVIILHASGGLDARNERWSRLLLQQGYATFQVDYFGPRGVAAESRTQPTPVRDVAEALRLLTSHPRVDPKRVAVIGFSRGATMALESMNFGPHEAAGHTLAAHVALYPDCLRTYVNRGGSGAPVLVLVADGDDISPPEHCQRLAEIARGYGLDVRVSVYEGAAHGWDGDFSGTWYHPAVGRSYTMVANRRLTELSQQEVLRFLATALGPLNARGPTR